MSSGFTDIVDPVHASSALRCEILQSVVPFRCNMAKDVRGDLVEMRAVTGDVDVSLWYKKGMPTRARRSGERIRSAEIVSSGEPESPTRLPLRV